MTAVMYLSAPARSSQTCSSFEWHATRFQRVAYGSPLFSEELLEGDLGLEGYKKYFKPSVMNQRALKPRSSSGFVIETLELL